MFCHRRLDRVPIGESTATIPVNLLPFRISNSKTKCERERRKKERKKYCFIIIKQIKLALKRASVVLIYSHHSIVFPRH